MKNLKTLLVALFAFGATTAFSQTAKKCERCNMNIKDQLHQATAIDKGEVSNFDAIECLINYVKTETVSDMKVADYNTGKMIQAETAYYLKSKAIPSPMGAFLSAFSTKEAAEKMQTKKGGETFNWEELVEKFKSSDFGALEHNHHNHARPDAHAPIGVMGDHLHHKGGLMVSMRYMNMTMDGNLGGTSEINDEVIYQNFMVAPQHMSMQMYMLGVMYAPSDRLTLMAMQNYVENSMDLTARMMMGGMMGGMPMLRDFSTNSEGFGDLKLGALYGLFSDEKSSLHLNSMVNLPIGSIEERDGTPMNNDTRLPYRMQLGSGTFDYTLGATFKKSFKLISLGTQVMGTVRTGENSEGYRLGNQLNVNVWGAFLMSPNISVSARVQGTSEGKIVGNDDELNPMMITTANTNNYGGERVRSFIGINVSFAENPILNRFRIGAEVGAPFYENYSGIQMNEGLNIHCGIKYSVL